MEFVLKWLRCALVLLCMGSLPNCKRTAFFAIAKKQCTAQSKKENSQALLSKLKEIVEDPNLKTLNYKNEDLIISLLPVKFKPFSDDGPESLLLKFDSKCTYGAMIVFPSGNIQYYYENIDSNDLKKKTNIDKDDFVAPYNSQSTFERFKNIIEYEY